MKDSTVPGAMSDAEGIGRSILPLRERAEVRNEWLEERLDTVLPEIMERESFDLWLVVAREYNEDPVLLSLLPEPAMSARRRTILLFHRQSGGKVERLALDRYGYGNLYGAAWNPEREGQFECLRRLLRERNPEVIGINRSTTFGIGDGLSHTEFTNLAKALGDELMERTRGAERLALGWLERRIDAELEAYPAIVELGHRIIAEAFSSATIQPGVTTTDDVVWWMRQRMLDLGLRAWFQPTIDIQADGLSFEMPGDSKQSRAERRKRILPGDLIHCDMGFHYLGLATDQQQNAYVLRPGETDAPGVLREALADGNRLQDIHAEEMAPGRTGNEVLKAALARAKEEGIEASIYTHPIGYHGHGAGPTIGLWDQQDGVPGKGDYEVFDRTCYAIELNVTRAIPEWGGQLPGRARGQAPGRPRGQAPGRARGQVVRVALEEDAALVDGRLQWLSGRQTRFHLIG